MSKNKTLMMKMITAHGEEHGRLLSAG